VETVTFRPTSRQLRNLFLLTAGLAGGSAAALVYLFGQHADGRLLGAGVGLGVAALVAGLVLAGFLGAFTECSPVGISTRGLYGRHQCAWPEVAEIAVCQPSMRYGRGTPTLSVTVSTGSGKFRLGAPISGGIAVDPDFEPRAREIRDYWRTATGSTASDPSSPLPVDSSPPEVPPALTFAAVAVVLAVSAAVAVPIALSRGGSALLARLGRGEPGYFTASGRMCASACYWIGEFTPRHGPPRDGMLMAQGGIRLGGKIPAVFVGNAPVTYPAGGGTAWIPPAITVGVLIACLAAAAFAIGRYQRQLSDIRHGRQPRSGRQPLRAQRLTDRSTMAAKIRKRTAMTTAALFAVVICEWFALIAAVAATPAAPPSAAQIACADYTTWSLAQNPNDLPDRDPAELAQAMQEAPPGSLAVDLGVLSQDAQSAMAGHGTDTGLVAEANVVNDMGLVNKDCSAAAH
jgi:hypothetical protein